MLKEGRKGREGKGREGKGREGKGRKGKERKGKEGRKGSLAGGWSGRRTDIQVGRQTENAPTF